MEAPAQGYTTEKREADCLFCAIAEYREPAVLVLETDDHVCFLDSRPLFFGHVLVIPRVHYETIFDMPGKEAGGLFTTVQLVATAVKSAMEADGALILSNNGVSQSVTHLHVHAVPRNKKDGLRGFMWPRLKYEDGNHAEEVGARIRGALQ